MDWPHCPVHRLGQAGVYIVTCGTYGRVSIFRGAERLAMLQDALMRTALNYGWGLQAWSLFSNHYHFVGESPADPRALPRMIGHFHAETARIVNEMDGAPGRKVWFNYWDTLITFQRSYLVRLSYVHNNPVKHGLVAVATQYPWCSAAWFERNASPSFQKTLAALKTDYVNVRDDFSFDQVDATW